MLYSDVSICSLMVSVVSLLKVPEVWLWVYKGLLDEVLCHSALIEVLRSTFSYFATQCTITVPL